MSFVMNVYDNNTIKYWAARLENNPDKERFLRTKLLEIRTFKSAMKDVAKPKKNNMAHFSPTKMENCIAKGAKVAVVIPAFIKNKRATRMLFATIECLQKQTVAPYSVIVVNDCSPYSFVIEGDFVTCFDLKENRGPANARNIGIDLALKSGADIIAFTDSDTRPSFDWIENIIDGFIGNKNAQVLSGLTVSFGSTWYDKYHTINGTLNGRRFCDSPLLLYGPTCNLAVVASAIGNTRFSCDFPLAASEDIYFCYELLKRGCNIFFCPNMKIAHDFGYKKISPLSEISNRKSFKRQFLKYAKGESILLDKIPDYYSYLKKTREISPVCNKLICLVTGGAGFIGSNLCHELLKMGRKVICLDNLVTGSIENIKDIADSNFKFVKADVTAPYDIFADEIYNLACPASPVQYQKDPVKTLLTSVLGAKNALDNANRYGAKVLQTSTSEIYGDPQVSPQPETYRGYVNPIGERSCYDEGKRAAETLFFDSYRTEGTIIKVVRIFNTYGRGVMAGDGRVISNFIKQAKDGDDLVVYGDGRQTRSFCYVDDTVRALILMMASSFGITGPINIGRDEEVSIIDLANRVIKITSSSSKIKFGDLPHDDPRIRRPDLTSAKKILGWESKIPLDEGLCKIINCS